MSESIAPNISLRRIELPVTTAEPDFVAASPQQLARLQYLGIAVQEPLASSEASQLIDQTNHDPAFAEKIEAWEAEKQGLHPDLFQAPLRSRTLTMAAPSSFYAPTPGPESSRSAAGSPSIQPPRFSPAKFLVPLAGVAVLAALGTAGWFASQSSWLFRLMHRSATVAVSTLPLAKSTAALPAPPPAAEATLAPEDLALRVTEAQRLAVAKYPALGTANTEINSRFVFRYKRLLKEHSPRLRDPSWPLQLADECAAASGLKPPPSGVSKAAPAKRPRNKSARTDLASAGNL